MTVCVAVFVDGESRAVDGCLRGRRGRSVGGDQSVLTVCVVSIDRHRFGTLVGDLLTVGNQFVAAGKLLTGCHRVPPAPQPVFRRSTGRGVGYVSFRGRGGPHTRALLAQPGAAAAGQLRWRVGVSTHPVRKARVTPNPTAVRPGAPCARPRHFIIGASPTHRATPAGACGRARASPQLPRTAAER